MGEGDRKSRKVGTKIRFRNWQETPVEMKPTKHQAPDAIHILEKTRSRGFVTGAAEAKRAEDAQRLSRDPPCPSC